MTSTCLIPHFDGGSDEAENEQIIEQPSADIVVEATFTNSENGEPALSHCKIGKHVVTTNKGPVALGAAALQVIAVRHNMLFKYEGAVMSGTPVIRIDRCNDRTKYRCAMTVSRATKQKRAPIFRTLTSASTLSCLM